MAGKPLNRLDLRRQREAAEPLDPMEDESDEVVEETDDEEVAEKKPKKKGKAPAKPKAKSSRAPKPAARMRIVWVVLNDAFKPVGTFDYNQKEARGSQGRRADGQGQGDALRAAHQGSDARRRTRHRRGHPASRHSRSKSLTRQGRRDGRRRRSGGRR